MSIPRVRTVMIKNELESAQNQNFINSNYAIPLITGMKSISHKHEAHTLIIECKSVPGADNLPPEVTRLVKSSVLKYKDELKKRANVEVKKAPADELNEKMFNCEKCNVTFEKLSHFKKHQLFHLSEKPFICIKCKESFNFKCNLDLHMSLHAENFKCSCCDKMFRRAASLKSHLRIHYKDEIISCLKCHEEFYSFNQLNNHSNISGHGQENTYINILTKRRKIETLQSSCEKKFTLTEETNPENYLIKSKNHNLSREATLVKKGVRNKAGKLQKRKFKCKRSEYDYVCRECGKYFSRPSLLKRHSYSHNEERPFPCAYNGCNKTFRQNVTMKMHLRTHYDYKPWECEFCGKTFSQKGNLLIHIKSLHPPKNEKRARFPCLYCACIFHKPNNLNAHMRNVHPLKEVKLDGKNPLIKDFFDHVRISQDSSKNEVSVVTSALAASEKDDAIISSKTENVDVLFPTTSDNFVSPKLNLVETPTGYLSSSTFEKCNSASCYKNGECETYFYKTCTSESNSSTNSNNKDSLILNNLCINSKTRNFSAYNWNSATKKSGILDDKKRVELEYVSEKINDEIDIATIDTYNDAVSVVNSKESVHERKEIVPKKTIETFVENSSDIKVSTVSSLDIRFLTAVERLGEELKPQSLLVRNNEQNKRFYMCDFQKCPREFKKQSDLIRHLRTHTLEKPYKCNVCLRSFSLADTLRTHQITHRTEKKFLCKICDQRFKSKQFLDKHYTIHTQERPFDCTNCLKSFRTIYQRNSHVKCHTKSPHQMHKEKQKKVDLDLIDLPEPVILTVDALGKQIRKEKELNLVTDENEINLKLDKKKRIKLKKVNKLYNCAQCSLEFSNFKDFRSHFKVVHNGIKERFVCLTCGKDFPTKSRLDRHAKTHLDGRVFMCPICFKRFKNFPGCKKHIKTHAHECILNVAVEDRPALLEVKDTIPARSERLLDIFQNSFEEIKKMPTLSNEGVINLHDSINGEKTKNTVAKEADEAPDNIVSLQFNHYLRNSGDNRKNLFDVQGKDKRLLPDKFSVGNTNADYVRDERGKVEVSHVNKGKVLKNFNVKQTEISEVSKSEFIKNCSIFNTSSVTINASLTENKVLYSTRNLENTRPLLNTTISAQNLLNCCKIPALSIGSQKLCSTTELPKFQTHQIKVCEGTTTVPTLIRKDSVIKYIRPQNSEAKNAMSSVPNLIKRVAENTTRVNSSIRSIGQTSTGTQLIHSASRPVETDPNTFFPKDSDENTGVLIPKNDRHFMHENRLPTTKPFTPKFNIVYSTLENTNNTGIMTPAMLASNSELNNTTSLDASQPIILVSCPSTHLDASPSNVLLSSTTKCSAVVSPVPLQNTLETITSSPTNKTVENKTKFIFSISSTSEVNAVKSNEKQNCRLEEVNRDKIKDKENFSLEATNINSIKNVESHTFEVSNVDSVKYIENHNLKVSNLNSIKDAANHTLEVLNVDGIKDIENHISIKTFPCESCDKHFSTFEHLNEHSKSHFLPDYKIIAQKKIHSCPFCQKAFSSLEKYEDHCKQRCLKSCRQCSQSFSTRSLLSVHVKKTHRIKISKYKRAKNKNLRLKHGNIRQKNGTLLPKNGKLRLKDGDIGEKGKNLSSNGEKSPEKRVLRAEDKNTQNRENFEKKSETTSMKEVLYECSLCVEKLPTADQLQKHIDLHHRGEIVADKMLKARKAHSCVSCPKSFIKPSDLLRHTRTHTGEKPFSCAICAKKFAVKSAMTAHLRTHSHKKEYKCSVCNNFYSCLGSLKTHMTLHTGEKKFSCNYCGKLFRTSSHRKSHQGLCGQETSIA